MKKTILSIMAIALSTIASAQVDRIPPVNDSIELDLVVVSASRSKTEFTQTARNVTVITSKEIASAPVQSVNELLEYALNVDVRQRGAMGVQADISLRGGTFEQTLILLNGMKMTDPQTGHHNMNLPVTLDQIERIEILQGGGSRVFGPNAFAGAINIITKKGGDDKLGLNVMGGENGLMSGGLSTTFNVGKSSNIISGSLMSSDGYIDNTDFGASNIFVQSFIDLKDVDLTINAGLNDKAFGAQNFYTSAFPTQFEATQTQFASFQANFTQGSLVFTPKLYFRKHNDRFELYRQGDDYYQWSDNNQFYVMGQDTAPSWYSGHNFHQTEVFGSELAGSYKWHGGTTSFGLDSRNESVWSNVLGENADTIAVDHNSPNARYTKFASRTNVSTYFEHSYTSKKFSISGGVMFNMNSDFGNHWYPGIDLSYQLSNHFRPYASANRSVRFPSYTDLYYNRGGAIGSKDLKPEESINYELGTKFFSKKVNGNVAVFRREGKNLIDWIRFNGSNITQAANLTEVNMNGAELDLTYRTKPGYWLESIRFNYTFLQADTSSTDFESAYVLDFLKNKIDLSFSIHVWKNLRANYTISGQDREGGYYSVVQEKEVEYDFFMLHDLRVYWKADKFNVFVEASNLLDVEYNDFGNVMQPGRWIRLGGSYTFSLK